MVTIPELWIPIVTATVLTFAAGFVLHMLLPLHKGDWGRLPGEAGVLERMREAKVGAGMFRFPFIESMEELKTPEFQAKLASGPVGVLITRPAGPFQMAPSLVKMLAYHLAISVLVAYLAGRALPATADYYAVFRMAGTAGILAYAGAVFPFAIWQGTSGRHLTNQVVDGLVWGLVTAGSFAGFWPR